MCTMCGLILESNMLNEYAHMRGSAEGNNPENGEKRSAAACNTSGIANHYFLRNAMVGTQNVQFINSKGKEVQVQLPEDDKDKCFKRITVALRDHVFFAQVKPAHIRYVHFYFGRPGAGTFFSARTHSTR